MTSAGQQHVVRDVSLLTTTPRYIPLLNLRGMYRTFATRPNPDPIAVSAVITTQPRPSTKETGNGTTSFATAVTSVSAAGLATTRAGWSLPVENAAAAVPLLSRYSVWYAAYPARRGRVRGRSRVCASA